MVEFVLHGFQFFLSNMFKGCFFRKILSEQPVVVFIGSALPTVVRCGEIIISFQHFCNLLVQGKFFTIVGSDGMDILFNRQQGILELFGSSVRFFISNITNLTKTVV